MVAKIWKQNALLAILSFFFWPVLVFSLFKYWGDGESDIKVPFFIFVPVLAYTWYDLLPVGSSARCLKFACGWIEFPAIDV